MSVLVKDRCWLMFNVWILLLDLRILPSVLPYGKAFKVWYSLLQYRRADIKLREGVDVTKEA
jgi:hypothetical protein